MTFDDAPERFAIHSDRAYIDFIGDETTRERSDRQLSSEVASFGIGPRLITAVCLHESPAMIGEFVLIGKSDGSIELSVAIAQDYRGQHFASEISQGVIDFLLTRPEIKRVVGRVAETNAASLALVRALDMTETKSGCDERGKRWREFSIARGE
jgi:RimJ/RimL family protein N-acetyltransferase